MPSGGAAVCGVARAASLNAPLAAESTGRCQMQQLLLYTTRYCLRPSPLQALEEMLRLHPPLHPPLHQSLYQSLHVP